MTAARNITKERLKAGKIAFGLGVRFSRSVEIAAAAAASGYHYLFIDLEHSTMGIDVAAQICSAALASGICPLVRVPSQDHAFSARILDGGAQGIVVPHVHTAAAARHAVESCLYPPLGHRSTMSTAQTTGWQPMSAPDFARTVNSSLLLVALLESIEAIDNVEEIAAVDGIDVLSIGSNDLAGDMGIPGEFDHPRLLQAYDKVLAAARRNGKAVRLGGIYERRLLKRSIELGSRLVTLGNDFGFVLQGMRRKMAETVEDAAPELTQ
jgi:2-keto-3-deoxy-L-rhamnonate aldolase RhmA